ncbi:MAG: dipeptide epimerase [Planctomycetaceae bacterium]|jgi:L-alanine-DL-glutamate epimerase-like enolase superfamily enzyme|nr:dipeptide epimerase [Planctomycetaceae bacterium]
MKLRIIRVDLPLKHVFETSQRSVSVVRTILVELEQDGLRGHGEAYEDKLYNAYIEDMVDVLEECRESVEHYALADPVAFWRTLQPMLKKNPFVQSAVDCAACDLWGKMKNKPLWKIWGLSIDHVPDSSYTIGLDSLERIADRMAENPDWAIYRVKLGCKSDLQILQMLREKTKAPFHVDVNGGWNIETAIKRLEPMKELGVELLEQPLPADNFTGITRLKKEMKKRNCSIPIIADESWQTETDIERCAGSGLFDGINLKLVKCGGLIPARQLIAKAKHLGLKLTSANSIESTVGASAISQLAPLLDHISIDGPLLIEKKVGTGVRTEKGKLVYPNENGTGVRVPFR